MTALTVRTDPLGGSPLARAAAAGDAVVREWYEPVPRGREEWRARVERIRAEGPEGWAAVVAEAARPGGVAGARLARVAAGKGIVVTTGQQPGLFGGPIYTWSKALSARALADEIERATGVSTVPVFWAATDDADFEEASQTAVAVPGGVDVLRLSGSPRPGAPLSDTPLPAAELPGLLERLARGAGAAAHPGALEAARSSYHAGATVGSAYVALLRILLEPLGVVVVDASSPAVRRAAEPLLRRAIERAADVDRALAQRDAGITAAGLAPQVPSVPGLSLVFAVASGRKVRLPIGEGPEGTAGVELVPNVLLRPVVERSILPTVAYAAGPGELAYFAQVSAVAAALEAPAPLAVPRWSGTIIEPHVHRLLTRYGLAPDDVGDGHIADRAIARRSLAPGAALALGEAREGIGDLTARLTRALVDGAALVPAAVVEGFRRGAEHRLARLERRVLAAVKRRETAALRDLATLRGALFPLGVRQERALNFLPLLARHGPPLVAMMGAEAGAHARALVGPATDDRAGTGQATTAGRV
ncbi:MAG TPA: bacillithiol biosynthesis BshC [Gemmatimonadaceae bacterium]|nr:bacillithiol biosynthesis BshC [Gemmatimonadaceae bacterium]